MYNKILETLMKFKNNSFKEHINSLLDSAEKLLKYLPLHNYFKAVENVQNSYMVELRRIYVGKLLKEGLTNSDIARLMCKDHATISYLLKTTNESDAIRKEILPHYEEWVENNLYPRTYTEWVPSADHKHGTKSIIKYKLKSINNGKNNLRQNSSANSRVEEVA